MKSIRFCSLHTKKKSDQSQTFSGKRKIWVENVLPVRENLHNYYETLSYRSMFEGVPGSVWGLPGVSYEIY